MLGVENGLSNVTDIKGQKRPSVRQNKTRSNCRRTYTYLTGRAVNSICGEGLCRQSELLLHVKVQGGQQEMSFP